MINMQIMKVISFSGHCLTPKKKTMLENVMCVEGTKEQLKMENTH